MGYSRGRVLSFVACVQVASCTRRNPEYCELPEHCPGEICDLPTHTCVPIPDAYQRVDWIVFVSNRDGNDEIYRMMPDGSEQTNLTQNAAPDTFPLWAPTGERIAFFSTRDGGQQLFVMEIDGSNVQNVSQGQADEPSWSWDGSTLAFQSDRDGGQAIYRVRFDGSGLSMIYAEGMSPDWSPDGRLVLTDIGAEPGLKIVNSDGANPIPLTSSIDDDPAWSPDGSRIAMGRRFVDGDIFVIDVDGSNLANLTNTTELETTPLWSLDGTQVLVDRDDDEVIILGVGAGQYTNVTTSPAIDRGPAWSSDGSAVLFTSDREGNDETFRVPRAGGEPMNLTNNAAADRNAVARPRP